MQGQGEPGAGANATLLHLPEVGVLLPDKREVVPVHLVVPKDEPVVFVRHVATSSWCGR